MVWIRRDLSPSQLFELTHHRDNTLWDLIKCYTKAQLSFMDWVDLSTIGKSKRYLPVRVDSGMASLKYKKWEQKRPYRVLRIRLDEIKALYNKRTGHRLSVEPQ